MGLPHILGLTFFIILNSRGAFTIMAHPLRNCWAIIVVDFDPDCCKVSNQMAMLLVSDYTIFD